MLPHISVMWLYFIFIHLAILLDHSGYHFPWMLSTEFHDYHHLKFNECYGTALCIFDHLHGTDRTFRSKGYQKRHCISCSLEPVSSRFPLVQSTEDYKDEWFLIQTFDNLSIYKSFSLEIEKIHEIFIAIVKYLLHFYNNSKKNYTIS